MTKLQNKQVCFSANKLTYKSWKYVLGQPKVAKLTHKNAVRNNAVN